MPKVILEEKLKSFLDEDVGSGDITTNAIVPDEAKIRAQIVVKEPAVVAGLYEAKTFFEMLGVKFYPLAKDGDEVRSQTVIAEVEGDGRTILTAERTILNLIMRMSSIATMTRKLVVKVRAAGLNVRIAATRKTAPGLRYFDKRAVYIGGGDPHRMRLDDAVLIKDNHIVIAKGIDEAMKRVQLTTSFSKKIEIEAQTADQAVRAAELGADIVMLDNMNLREAKRTIEVLKERNLRNKMLIEISGGITEENIVEYARLEPDVISLGSLTHSAKAIDISLEAKE